ncbi:Cleavage stimulation factor subunit 2, hinge domain [Dillenia turbinata]|uniref:Cleavage stimulation factor subunit 2, hinge domain n=1 Tax=Dillenia turbinata TaxID=194707 RepID=A0AAN8VTR8_9MAGN
MANSQHRCVFVGNIPYDATEEQLIQICEEVGPVVSFRLVIDRETGKPKGYGFCEYKDEETALSARRNLQGYEINGRQLRVDFAENDKGADRNREQGRGGPGLAANVDARQVGLSASHRDSTLFQPMGLPVAMTAASVMAGALGGSQVATRTHQTGIQSQSAMGSDPLTLHLAKMSRGQLNQIMSELKAMTMHNRELARQLLLENPQLPKALFQAEIMLGMVTPQMLQNSNIRQVSGPHSLSLGQDRQQGLQPSVQTHPGLPPLAQNKVQFGMLPKVPEAQVPAASQPSLGHNPLSTLSQILSQPQIQFPQLAPNQASLHATSPVRLGISAIPSVRPQPLSNLSVGPPMQALPISSALKQQIQTPLPQQLGPSGAANVGHNIQTVIPNTAIPSSHSIHPSMADQSFQPGSSILPGISEKLNRDADRAAQIRDDPAWVQRFNSQSNLASGLSEKAKLVRDAPEPINRPSKLIKLDDGRNSIPVGALNGSTVIQPRFSQFSGVGPSSANHFAKAEEPSASDKQVPQLPPEVESALLEQVMKLTPEQLSSLPPEQQQQVLQLQQMLR